MAKVQRQSQPALDAAHALLEAVGVRHRRDINAHAFAAKHGARILYGPVKTSRANIVRAGEHAIIYIDEKTKGTRSEDLTIGHELGHKDMHKVADHYEQCDPDGKPRSGTAWRLEKEAYDFGRALLAPAFLAASYCTAPRPTLDDVERFWRAFPLSLEVSVIRYLQLADAAGISCAGVIARPNGTIKWATETRPFPGKIVKDHKLHPSTVAARVHRTRKDRGGEPREVPGEAWGGEGPFIEQSICLGASGGVLSWIIPA